MSQNLLFFLLVICTKARTTLLVLCKLAEGMTMDVLQDRNLMIRITVLLNLLLLVGFVRKCGDAGIQKIVI